MGSSGWIPDRVCREVKAYINKKTEVASAAPVALSISVFLLSKLALELAKLMPKPAEE
jgi:hypothetical protein